MFRNHPTLSRVLIYGALGVLITYQGVIALQQNLPNNGFDLSSTSIPAEQIFNGGPPKDGIPAIDEPRFLAANKAHTLKPDDSVHGSAIITDRVGELLPAVSGFWFAWMAFHPQSSVYSAMGE